MQPSLRLAPLVPTLAVVAVTVAALGAAAAEAQVPHRNVSAGGTLRHGVYGRIEVRGASPPVIYPTAVLASEAPAVPGATPVYLYVPTGQVRRWKQHCAKWAACNELVLFVRMDESPGRWGQWRLQRDQVALQGAARQ